MPKGGGSGKSSVLLRSTRPSRHTLPLFFQYVSSLIPHTYISFFFIASCNPKNPLSLEDGNTQQEIIQETRLVSVVLALRPAYKLFHLGR